jgi:hypothetical protein
MDALHGLKVLELGQLKVRALSAYGTHQYRSA